MKDKDEFYYRAAKVREIAKGIYDQTERKFVEKFVKDSEKLFKAVEMHP